MKLITLSGLDGSGKSTQIELLKKYLDTQGKTFFYFHAVEFSIANRKKSKSGGEKSVTKANWLKIQLRKIALLIDIFRFKRLMKTLKVDYVISDRYFFDSVVNILFLEKKQDPSAAFGMTFIMKAIPKPNFAFFIDVKPGTIMQRERKPDQGMAYLDAKERIYKSKIMDWKMDDLNGERSKEEIFEDILNKLSKVLPKVQP